MQTSLCYKITYLLAHQLLVQGFLHAITARSGTCMVVSDSSSPLGRSGSAHAHTKATLIATAVYAYGKIDKY